MSELRIIPERSGTAFRLAKGERLVVIDPCGEQVPTFSRLMRATREGAILGPHTRLC
jgi:uncharacterized protein YcgI (DUF1989 family)